MLAQVRRVVWLIALALCVLGCEKKQNAPVVEIKPRTDYTAVVQAVEGMIKYEMRDKALPAISIALVDNQETVWAKGFGMADPDSNRPASAQTMHRVGSVSKLFTDIGIMQLVEKGELDLDAPITNYLPDFQPHNPFGKAITLRQLMSHRSGLVREPPVGNYFDPTNPSLAAMVASLNATTLVYAPEQRVKYSNAGIATVGYVLERKSSKPFTKYLREAVLLPLGMEHSAFEPLPEIQKNLAKAYMWSYDHRRFRAPTFELGMAPAGSMYAPVPDLAKFLSVLFNGGKSANAQVLKPETLEQMWTPQFAATGEKNGYGIGFALSELHGHRRIGHGGAIYGFATELAALPEPKLGAAVVTTLDCANEVVTRIADYALECMLAQHNGAPLPEFVPLDTIAAAIAHERAGRYAHGENEIELLEHEGKLSLRRRELLVQLKARGDTLVVDDPLAYGLKIIIEGERLRIGEERYERAKETLPAPPPESWQGLIGEYGWDHNTLFIHERHGKLHALIEWFFDYPLQEIVRDTFAFPNYGLYHGEKLIFTRDANAQATHVEVANVVFKRRAVGTAAGKTFRITPLKPIAELRQLALASQPPEEHGDFYQTELVELQTLDSSIKYDVRYATTNNFMSAVFYDQQKAFMQRPAAEALVRAHQKLKQRGYGLLIHDAYRPWYVTKMFWEATPNDKRIFVADPSQGSRHNRGCAVDLTLYDLKTGAGIEMVSGYDEFSERAYPEYPGGTSLQRYHRELLRNAMEAEGFRVYEWEWWHFDYQDWKKYRIGNLRFEEILSAAR